MGHVDHVRGDGERARRRRRLHRRLERSAHPAPRLHLRGPGRRAVEPPADHERGPVRARGGRVEPEGERALPDRGQLRLPVGLLPLLPPDGSDGDRQPRRRRATPDAPRRRAAERASRRQPGRTGRRTTSTGSTSPIPTRRSRTRPVSRHRPRTTRPSATSATRVGRRARPASRVSRAPPSRRG